MKSIDRISNFSEIIALILSVKDRFYSHNFVNDILIQDILSISEPILNRKNSTEENLKQYSTAAISLVDLIKLGKATDHDFEAWYQRAKINLAEIFILLSYDYLNKDNYFPDSDDELDKMLLDVYTARTATRARSFCPPSPLTAYGHCPANIRTSNRTSSDIDRSMRACP